METYEIRDVNKHDDPGYDALGKHDGFPYCESKKLHEYYHVHAENYEFDLNISSAIAISLFDHSTLISTLSSELNSRLTVFTLSAYNMRVISEIWSVAIFSSQGRWR